MPGFAAQCCRSGSCAAQFPSPSFHASLTLDGCRRAQEPPAAYYRKQKGAEPSQPPRALPERAGENAPTSVSTAGRTRSTAPSTSPLSRALETWPR
jgi:hypothetical protein